MSGAMLDRWYTDAAQRRLLPLGQGGETLTSRFTGSDRPGHDVAKAAARTLVTFVGRRAVELGFERGVSCADVEHGRVNLDGQILDGASGEPARFDRLLGVAAHEGAHLAHTTCEQIPRDALFKAIGNVLEDERIEGIVTRELPALASAMHAARVGLLRPAPDNANFLPAVFTLVRCAAPISPALWNRYADRLEAVITALTPYPQTPEEIRRATLEIGLLVPPEQWKDIPPSWQFSWLAAGAEAVDDEADDFESLDPVKGGRGHHRLRGRPPRVRGRGICASWPRVVWRDAKADLPGYVGVRSSLGRKPETLAARIHQLLPRRRAARRNTGRLDVRRLYAHDYDPNLFKNRTSSERVALAIVVILDLSGSMAGDSEETAREMAVLLAETVRRLPAVRIEFFGHDADSGSGPSTRITRYPIDAQGRVPGLGSLEIGGNNRDAHAIRVIGDTLRDTPSSPAERKIAILIADGAPSANGFNGEIAREKTREAILWLERSWGPLLYVATAEVESLRKMIPGPSVRFSAGRSLDGFSQRLTGVLHRAVGGAG
jgi:Mg-chelatase subunit ChlD